MGGDGGVERFCSAGGSCLNGEQEAQQPKPEQPDPERAWRSGSLRIGTKALLFLSQLLRGWGLQQRGGDDPARPGNEAGSRGRFQPAGPGAVAIEHPEFGEPFGAQWMGWSRDHLALVGSNLISCVESYVSA